jgi:shikimate dehydrogenase
VSDRYAEVIGDPIAHSKSPIIHGFWLESRGVPGRYDKTHVLAGDLADFIYRRRRDPDWRGCNVTIPHKLAVMSLADVIDEAAERVGAANCLYYDHGRLVATNTDVIGVGEALSRTLVGEAVCLIGAGGAARAALVAAYALGASDFRLVLRDPAKGEQLLAELGMRGRLFSLDDSSDAFRGAAVVINASPLGMVGSPAMPPALLDHLALLDSGATVFDMVYAPLETELLARARSLDLIAADGLTMLIGQAGEAFFDLFGVAAPREHDAELRRRLTA